MSSDDVSPENLSVPTLAKTFHWLRNNQQAHTQTHTHVDRMHEIFRHKRKLYCASEFLVFLWSRTVHSWLRASCFLYSYLVKAATMLGTLNAMKNDHTDQGWDKITYCNIYCIHPIVMRLEIHWSQISIFLLKNMQVPQTDFPDNLTYQSHYVMSNELRKICPFIVVDWWHTSCSQRVWWR